MMKRRILVLLLAVCCMLSLASCFKDTPQSLYKDAKKALAEATRYEAKITIIADGLSNQSVMNLKVDGKNMQITIEDETFLYVDGMLYQDMGNEKIKAAISAEDLEMSLGMPSVMPDLSKEMLKNVELVENGENRAFTVFLDEQMLKNYMGKSLDHFTAGLPEYAGTSFSEASFTATFDKNDNLIKMSIIYHMQFPMQGEYVTPVYKIESIMEIIKIDDQLPAITAPADASSYKEMPSGQSS